MDFATLERLLINYGVPLVIMFAVGWGGWIAFWRLAKYVKPHIDAWFEDERDEREKRIESMNTIIETQQSCASTLQDTNRVVHSIDERQSDPRSIISNVQTHVMIGRLLRNDGKAAKAGIVAMEAIAEHQPELRPKLQQAIDVLRQVEQGDA